MKKPLLFATLLAGLMAGSACAQPGPPSPPSLDGVMAKLFGENTGFSASLEFHATGSQSGEMVMPGKISFLDGKSRFDMDMSKIQGGHVPPQAAARMKQMGMGRMSAISVPDKRVSYLMYPDMKAYIENPSAGAASAAAPSDYKAETTKLGEETIDGHNCVKNKIVVTGPDGAPHESTVWNASDLNQFPLKIQVASDNGSPTVLLFKDVKLVKPDASQFEIPADYTKYDNMMSMMMSVAGKMRGQ